MTRNTANLRPDAKSKEHHIADLSVLEMENHNVHSQKQQDHHPKTQNISKINFYHNLSQQHHYRFLAVAVLSFHGKICRS